MFKNNSMFTLGRYPVRIEQNEGKKTNQLKINDQIIYI